MLLRGHLLGIIVMVSIIIFGLIHFVVAVVIIAEDDDYSDIFEPQIGLSAYNIILAIICFLVGGFGLFSVLTDRGALSRIVAIVSVVLCVCTFASLIAALVINGQSNSYVSEHLTDEMNRYVRSKDAVDVIDSIQRKYECCGENLWLDWAYTPLGTTNAGSSSILGRRRRHSTFLFNALTQHFRQKRQYVLNNQNLNNLPLSYGVYLPASCCTNGGTITGNYVGTYCVTQGTNAASSFYLSGCLQPLANRAVSQTMGTAVINCFLIVISIIVVPVLIHIYPDNFWLPNMLKRRKAKKSMDPQQNQQQQQQYQEQQSQEQQYQEPRYQESQYNEHEQRHYSEPYYPPPQYQPQENNLYTINPNAYHTQRYGVQTSYH